MHFRGCWQEEDFSIGYGDLPVDRHSSATTVLRLGSFEGAAQSA